MRRATKAKTSLLMALLVAAVAVSTLSLFRRSEGRSGQIGMAVEFMDHAAAAFVAAFVAGFFLGAFEAVVFVGVVFFAGTLTRGVGSGHCTG